jgi:hypothetical protein
VVLLNDLFTSTLQNNRRTDPAGTLDLRAGALGRNLFNVGYDRPLPLLDFTLGGVFGYPYNLNKTRIPRPCRQGKWSWRGCSMQLQGLVTKGDHMNLQRYRILLNP